MWEHFIVSQAKIDQIDKNIDEEKNLSTRQTYYGCYDRNDSWQNKIIRMRRHHSSKHKHCHFGMHMEGKWMEHFHSYHDNDKANQIKCWCEASYKVTRIICHAVDGMTKPNTDINICAIFKMAATHCQAIWMCSWEKGIEWSNDTTECDACDVLLIIVPAFRQIGRFGFIVT